MELHAFDLPMARPTAEMWVSGKGLSLGDLACMALAKEVHGTAVTTASGWMAAGADILAIQ